MRCPKCNQFKTGVVDSRMRREGTSISRRRVCPSCKFRFSTTEVQVVSATGASFLMVKMDAHLNNLRAEFSKDLQEISRRPERPEQVEDRIKQRLLARTPAQNSA